MNLFLFLFLFFKFMFINLVYELNRLSNGRSFFIFVHVTNELVLVAKKII